MGLTMQAYTSLRGEVWVYIAWLTLPLVIEVSVPSHESDQSCICVLGVLMLFLSTILIFDFGIVAIVRYYLYFILLTTSIHCPCTVHVMSLIFGILCGLVEIK